MDTIVPQKLTKNDTTASGPAISKGNKHATRVMPPKALKSLADFGIHLFKLLL